MFEISSAFITADENHIKILSIIRFEFFFKQNVNFHSNLICHNSILIKFNNRLCTITDQNQKN